MFIDHPKSHDFGYDEMLGQHHRYVMSNGKDVLFAERTTTLVNGANATWRNLFGLPFIKLPAGSVHFPLRRTGAPTSGYLNAGGTSMWNRSRILGLGFVLSFSGLIAIIVAHNAAGQSGTRSGGGGFGNGGGGASTGGGGGSGGGGVVSSGGAGGRALDPLGLAHNLILSGQAGGTAGTGERNPVVPVAERLSQYLLAAQYQNWSPMPGQANEFSKGVGPHGAFVKTYVNRNVASDPDDPNYGSILLQENYSKDKARLLDVTVMLRIKGFDAAHNDWFWAQYLPNGALAREGQTKLAGQVTSCINCHRHAEGRDFIFGNSQPPAG